MAKQGKSKSQTVATNARSSSTKKVTGGASICSGKVAGKRARAKESDDEATDSDDADEYAPGPKQPPKNVKPDRFGVGRLDPSDLPDSDDDLHDGRGVDFYQKGTKKATPLQMIYPN